MDRKELVRALVEDHGRLWSEEIGAKIEADTPEDWFHWLLAALLMSARIDVTKAAQASAALRLEDLRTVPAVLDCDRAHLVRVLNENGYARFDNKAADQIREAAELVEREYGGDLRRLREAGGDAEGIRARLKQVKGIGDVGADIFAREAQLAWDELFPMADPHAVRQAQALGLPERPEELAQIAGGRLRFVRLVTGLARSWLAGASDRVKEAAG
ncbi:MAG: hypothetical protein ACLFQL_08895 [Paracoccaceae bacterium]